jgi:ABC-2 type transport system permease protein
VTPSAEAAAPAGEGPAAAPAVRRLVAQTAAELSLTLRRGESLLLTVAIPVVLLAFLSEVHLLPTGRGRPVDFLTPGILALAVMSTSLVNLSIATGFERGYGVLKRLGATPLGRGVLLGAKIAAIVTVEVLQAALLVAVAFGLGWRPSGAGAAEAVAVVLLATCGFAGIGLLLAGVLRPEVNLAAANGLWLVLLLISGMLAPLTKLPAGLADVSRALPAAALSDALHRTLGSGTAVAGWSWAVLGAWAVLGPLLAARFFRWE